ncbi:hypothetical protein B0H17DRAFT_1185531 [Mycena rosella]|uniref:Uncharacterized protein n=1 Tax=Mycena rosella TaxID=1033263 RepID=A0AAD7CQX4_MYCRO|nr:hypothetical protein B0H17DRAFT_1185531 [Mycena rosella]
MTLLNVCNTWKDIALSIPALSASIHVVPPLNDFDKLMRGANARAITNYLSPSTKSPMPVLALSWGNASRSSKAWNYTMAFTQASSFLASLRHLMFGQYEEPQDFRSGDGILGNLTLPCLNTLRLVLSDIGPSDMRLFWSDLHRRSKSSSSPAIPAVQTLLAALKDTQGNFLPLLQNLTILKCPKLPASSYLSLSRVRRGHIACVWPPAMTRDFDGIAVHAQFRHSAKMQGLDGQT